MMHKVYENEKKICELKHTLMCWNEEALAMGKECLDAKELGEVVDMIKDCFEMEKYLWESAYYKSVVEAMHDADEVRGYDNWRYSSGRFAPKGHGRRMGYLPSEWMEGWRDDPMMDYPLGIMEEGRMGYPMSDHETSGGHMDMYRKYRKGYTESHSDSDKKAMNDHAEHHLREAYASMKEIWKDADPQMKQKMKTDVTKLLGEMT